MLYVSIDYGSTNTVVCVFNGWQYRFLQFDGSWLLSSAVWIKNENELICGEAAVKALKHFGNRVVTNNKRFIGRKFDEISEFTDYCGVPLIKQGENVLYHLNNINKYFSPEDIAAVVFKRIWDVIKEQFNNAKVDKLILTIPASFGNGPRTALREAALRIFGEDVSKNKVIFINEPSAAAIPYNLIEEDVDDMDNLSLIYDLGGGTFDCSLVQSGSQIQVKDSSGNPRLGGADFDGLIAKDFLKKYENLSGSDYLEGRNEEERKKILQILSFHACAVKIELSSKTNTGVKISTIDNPDDGDDNDDFDYSREELIKAIGSHLDKTIDCINELISRNGYSRDQIKRVILVGGSSRIPAIYEKLETLFKGRVLKTDNLETCVAEGACKYLVQCESNAICLNDRISFSLGFEIADNQVKWLIPSNSPIPCPGKGCLVVTNKDNQRFGYTSVVQGKSDKACVENLNECEHTRLSMITFRGFELKPRGEVEFRITFNYTSSGIVHVKVEETATQKVLFDRDIEFRQ